MLLYVVDVSRILISAVAVLMTVVVMNMVDVTTMMGGGDGGVDVGSSEVIESVTVMIAVLSRCN